MLKRLKVGPKLVGGFFLVALILVAVGLAGFYGLVGMTAQAQRMVRLAPLMQAAQKLANSVTADQRVLMEILAASRVQEVEEFHREHQRLAERFDVYAEAMLAGGDTPTGRVHPAQSQGLRRKVEEAQVFHDQEFQPTIGEAYRTKLAMLEQRRAQRENMDRVESGFASMTAQARELEEATKERIQQRLASGAPAREIVATESAWADLAMEIKATLGALRIAVEEYAQELEAADLESVRGEYQEADEELAGWLRALLEGGRTSEGLVPALTAPGLREKVQEMASLHAELLRPSAERFMQGRRELARLAALVEELDEKADAAGGEMAVLLAQVEDQAMGSINEAEREAAELAWRSEVVAAAGTAAGFLLALLLGWLISRSVTRPVAEAVRAVASASAGDFTHQMDGRLLARGDELGAMLRDVQSMNERLSDTVREVAAATATVASAANQISQGNQDLSDRTQQQASAIEETASAVEQMAGSVKANASSADQANQNAKDSAETAREGGKAVHRTMEAMEEANQSSKKIADIINVVNEIAFQTNLLALNAAVEAARAGEAGRGFAVVAGEVRSLAGRSASAAKEIQALITDSVGKVEQAGEMVTESGRLLDRIIEQVESVADSVGQITSTSREQARGIDEINRAVGQMDQGVQQNAALVEESASAAENMASAAEELRSQMDQFKVAGQGQALLASRPERKAREEDLPE
jgi:methyl-accepting chemotaxis protein